MKTSAFEQFGLARSEIFYLDAGSVGEGLEHRLDELLDPGRVHDDLADLSGLGDECGWAPKNDDDTQDSERIPG